MRNPTSNAYRSFANLREIDRAELENHPRHTGNYFRFETSMRLLIRRVDINPDLLDDLLKSRPVNRNLNHLRYFRLDVAAHSG